MTAKCFSSDSALPSSGADALDGALELPDVLVSDGPEHPAEKTSMAIVKATANLTRNSDLFL